jgi:6-phosphogluconolactonase
MIEKRTDTENRELRVLADVDQLSHEAAVEFVLRAKEAVETKQRFMVALSGGTTPRRLYELLAARDQEFREQIPWHATHFFWSDERHVPPDHPDSNYRMAQLAMLSKVPVPLENVHRIEAANPDAKNAAEQYEKTLRQYFQLAPDELPRFDLILLGLGPCGHTASLFPESEVLNESKRLVVAPWVKKFNSFRITLTPPVINNASEIVFLVSGEDKAAALRTVLEENYNPNQCPAQLIHPTHGRLLWFVDQAAAGMLSARARLHTDGRDQ